MRDINPAPGGLGAALEIMSHRLPDQHALVGFSRSMSVLTYGGWSRRSREFADRLRNTDPARPIILYFHDQELTELAVALFGVIQAGRLALPMSNRFSFAEVSAVHERYRCQAVVLGPLMKTVLGKTGQSNAPILADVPAGGVPAAAAEGSPELDRGPQAGQAGGCIIYTSGTTGAPKAVLCTEENLLRLVARPGPGMRPYMYQYPFDTSAGLSGLLRTMSQYPAAHTPMFDTVAIARSVEVHVPKEIFLVPAGVRALMQSETTIPSRQASQVDLVMVSSAVCRTAELVYLRQVFPSARLVNLYSSTEAGAAHTIRVYAPGESIGLAERGALTPVGRPQAGSHVRITDTSGKEVSPGTEGVVWLRADGDSGRAYFGTDGDDSQVFQKGWVRTGDLGLLDESGELYLAGREADTINKGGINISAAQIEAVLRGHPGVADSAVFALPDQALGEEVYAAVTCCGPLREDDVKGYVTDRLGRFKTPAGIVVVPQLPANSLGKVMKRELQAQLSELLTAPRGSVAGAPQKSASAAGDDDRIVAHIERIWAEMFPDAGTNGDFFENGGDSLAAIDIAARILKETNIRVSPIDVIENPTPDALAAVIRAHGDLAPEP